MITWFRKAFLGNIWLWFHILAAGISAKVGLMFLSQIQTFYYLAIAMLLWELGELLTIMITKNNPYGSLRYFLYDASGDVLGTMAITIIIIF